MTSGSNNRRLDRWNSIKIWNIDTRLNQIESNLESKIKEQVNENIMSIKDSIITALKNEN